MRAGGIDSRLIRMPRYVVPQIKQTATHAKYARRRCAGEVGTGSGNRIRVYKDPDASSAAKDLVDRPLSVSSSSSSDVSSRELPPGWPFHSVKCRFAIRGAAVVTLRSTHEFGHGSALQTPISSLACVWAANDLQRLPPAPSQQDRCRPFLFRNRTNGADPNEYKRLSLKSLRTRLGIRQARLARTLLAVLRQETISEQVY